MGPLLAKKGDTEEPDFVQRLAALLNSSAKEAILLIAEKDLRIAELEAELAEAKRRIYWLRRLKMPDSDALAKANKEWSELLGDAEIRAEKAEAEVKRLSRERDEYREGLSHHSYFCRDLPKEVLDGLAAREEAG